MSTCSFNTGLLALAPVALDRAAAILLGVGLLIALAAAVLHWRRHGVDPFSGAKVRRNRITVLLALLPMAAFLVASTFLQAVRQSLQESFGTDLGDLNMNTLAQVIGAACCLGVAAHCFRGGVRGFLLGHRGVLRPIGIALVYLLAVAALCELTAQATKCLFLLVDPTRTFPEHRVLDALHDPTQPTAARLLLCVGATVVAPVAEECFFRGMLQTMLLRVTHLRWLAVLVPAVLFGLAHADQMHVVPALTLFGAILGLQYERSGALLGPIALHAMFNLKTLLWHYLMFGGSPG